MGLAPVPLFFASDPIQAIKHCAINSKTTHSSPECVDACKLLGALILGAESSLVKTTLTYEIICYSMNS